MGSSMVMEVYENETDQNYPYADGTNEQHYNGGLLSREEESF
jgi:hypothetical protein